MKSKLAEKNLKDLEYHTFLNHFNLIVLFMATAYVSVVIGTLDKIEWSVSLVISSALLVLLFIVLVWLLFYSKLVGLKREIREL